MPVLWAAAPSAEQPGSRLCRETAVEYGVIATKMRNWGEKEKTLSKLPSLVLWEVHMNTLEISKDFKGTSRITGLRSRSPSYTRDEVEYGCGLLKGHREANLTSGKWSHIRVWSFWFLRVLGSSSAGLDLSLEATLVTASLIKHPS